jgi:uncharacterized radical SAM protein YgiQ
MLLNPKASEKEQKTHQVYIRELITRHVSGRLKVAPEHSSGKVLKKMRKPSFDLFRKFREIFNKINHETGLNQQLIPYFISSHPGCEEKDMAWLAAETRSLNFTPEQVQDFTPTPMTLATVMYYTGLDPYSLQEVYVPKSKEEKQRQRQYFFWYKPQVRKELEKRLKKAGWTDIYRKLFEGRKTADF